jgi:hypothetical protein
LSSIRKKERESKKERKRPQIGEENDRVEEKELRTRNGWNGWDHILGGGKSTNGNTEEVT